MPDLQVTVLKVLLIVAAMAIVEPRAAVAQEPEAAPAPQFQFDPNAAPGNNTTTVPRAGDTSVQVNLYATLTEGDQKIEHDLVWRVYDAKAGENRTPALINTLRQANPSIKLPPGDYIVNAAFGRAHLTKKLTLAAGTPQAIEEKFVLNAGGLRVAAVVPGSASQNYPATYSIFSDRDQGGDRKLIMSSVKPGVIIRLNSGIYRVVSTVGDANAVVSSDVTVEAGKLTEAKVTHAVAKATFKLVPRPGGEAIAGTQWTIQTQKGEVVKQSSGAIPTHVLAPGMYLAVAKSQGKTLQRSFTLKDGDTTQVEVLFQ